MLVDRNNLWMHRRWLTAVVGISLGFLGWFLGEWLQSSRFPGGSSRPGLFAGSLAGAIILFECLLWVRKLKRVRALRIGRTQGWLRAHIWLGLLCVPLVILHSGFSWGGLLSTVLAVVFGIVIASGVFGLVMQKILPRLMLETIPAETIYSQIDYLSRQFAADAQRLVLAACGSERESEAPALSESEKEVGEAFVVIGAVRTVGSVRGKVLSTQARASRVANPQSFRTAFFDTIKPYLEEGAGSGSLLKDRSRAAPWFEELRSGAGPEGQEVVEALANWCENRRQFDLQARMHRWLHGWLSIHLPLSAALLVLLVVHVFVALKYW